MQRRRRDDLRARYMAPETKRLAGILLAPDRIDAHCRGMERSNRSMAQKVTSDDKRAGLEALGLWKL